MMFYKDAMVVVGAQISIQVRYAGDDEVKTICLANWEEKEGNFIEVGHLSHVRKITVENTNEGNVVTCTGQKIEIYLDRTTPADVRTYVDGVEQK